MSDTTTILHGGNLTKAQRMFPGAVQPFIDLSTGINPYSYPVDWHKLDMSRLPEPHEEEALRTRAAYCYGVSSSANIGLSAGTQLLISLLPLVLPAQKVFILEPTYQEYARVWSLQGREVVSCFSIEEIYENLAQTSLLLPVAVIMCNPNNPDGRMYPAVQLHRFLERVQGRKGWLIIDEAYADMDGDSMAALIGTPGLIVLRSFGKTYGLAGLRLGFLLAEENVVQSMATLMGPWPVSAMAITAGKQALADEDWLIWCKNRLSQKREHVLATFSDAGLTVCGSTHLFYLIEVAGAGLLWELLCHNGLLVRRFDYNAQWLRFGIPKDEHILLRLEQALRVWKKNKE